MTEVLMGGISALTGKVTALEETNKRTGKFLQAVSDRKVKPQELKQAIEQIQGVDDNRLLNILKHLARGRYLSQKPSYSTDLGQQKPGEWACIFSLPPYYEIS
jgi:hypothetical protein